MKQEIRQPLLLALSASLLMVVTAAQSAELSRNSVERSAGPLVISNCEPSLPIGGCFVPPEQPATSQTVNIEPDPAANEADGDPAPVCVTWDATVRTFASIGAAAAAAAGGIDPDASARPPATATATTDGAAYYQINDGDIKPIDMSDESLGVTSPPDGLDTRSSSVFLRDTAIGDRIRIYVAAAAAVTAPEGGSAEASASSRVTLRLGPCEPLPPVTQVPTMSQWSLIVTALLLAALGYLGLRRRQE